MLHNGKQVSSLCLHESKTVADVLEFTHENLLNNELSILALLNY
jgi:hypothetical protein